MTIESLALTKLMTRAAGDLTFMMQFMAKLKTHTPWHAIGVSVGFLGCWLAAGLGRDLIGWVLVVTAGTIACV